jgi:CDP-diacylglycerol--serine O-phosphatidyltransferase
MNGGSPTGERPDRAERRLARAERRAERRRGRQPRRWVPFVVLLPNAVTLLALCAGLTSIRMAVDHRFDLAAAAIMLAVILDGIDGRLARYLSTTSRFGAELDSLADFVDFGVAPAVFLYIWMLEDLGSFGWICALALAICTALRLARFNAALQADEPPPDWQRGFFVGVPAPAGAVLALAPFALSRSLGPIPPESAALLAAYVLFTAFLMISWLPTYSGKRIGTRLPRERVVPVLALCVLLFALFASYPFTFIAVGSLLYLAHLPFAWRSWKLQAAKAIVPPDDDQPEVTQR